MNAELAIPVEARPRWRRLASVIWRRRGITPFIELAAVLALLATAVVSYFVVSDREDAGDFLSPPLVAGLLVAILVPAMALMVLIARRVAMRRATRSPIGGRGRLHVRLVALFSVLTTVPTLLVVIFASFLFQSGTAFWFSDRARGMLENASAIAQQNYQREFDRVNAETVAMAGDIVTALGEAQIDDPAFADFLVNQVFVRNLSEAVLMRITPEHGVQTQAMVNPYDRTLEDTVRPEIVRQLTGDRLSVAFADNDRLAAVARFPNTDLFLYAARVVEPELASQLRRGEAVLQDYRTLVERSRALQLRFNAILLVVSLLIVALSIWIALKLADRLVRPVGELVDAAGRVTAGDLSARVPVSDARDEVGTLGNAFNRMTRRLEEQTGALVSANAQLENRRAFIEAVLAGVTAGVISVDDDHVVRLINRSAEALLETGGESPVGQKLADLAPELDRQLAPGEREDVVVQLAVRGEPRTLAVKTVRVKDGYVLTFDDITEQLLDQRRAAWSDVARRIAHEIKNPLTPIQLAAERLQRRYSEEVKSDPSTFERLTGTIVRQVGDLRRMVDEFSSFARMPKPAFHEEAIVEIARQAMFLHEVAHPEIDFSLDAPDPSPRLVCDRRLLGQALTNVVKNGVEAIQHRHEEKGEGRARDRIGMRIAEQGSKIVIEIADTGIGLPADRGRLTEPYMTTRAKGTGLGLAIVKKIVEEHFGQVEFEDLAGGGSVVRFIFDAEVLGRLGGTSTKYSEETLASG